MARTYDIVEYHFGVSFTDTGLQVLTPFSRFGRAYEYSEELHRRFSAVARVLWWAVYAVALIGLGANVLAIFTWDQTANWFVIGIVILDFLRFVALRLVFAKRTPLDITPVRDVRNQVTFFTPFNFVAVLVLTISMELAFLSASLLVLINNSNRPHFAGLVLLFHALTYWHLHINSRVRY